MGDEDGARLVHGVKRRGIGDSGRVPEENLDVVRDCSDERLRHRLLALLPRAKEGASGGRWRLARERVRKFIYI